MKVQSNGLKGGLVCTALLASVAVVAGPASADPTVVFGAIAWDDAVPFGNVFDAWDFGAVTLLNPHPYGTFENRNSYFGNAGPIGIDSTNAPRPGWDWEMSFDFQNAGVQVVPGYEVFTNITVYLYIKEVNTTRPISEFEVKYNGNVIGVDTNWLPGDDQAIMFTISFLDLLGPNGQFDGILTVQWNQVPAPGALALLGLAGVMAKRRRRA